MKGVSHRNPLAKILNFLHIRKEIGKNFHRNYN
nr:MAG TPA: hypothetical protein [Caudoviricetes sp.]